MVTNTGIWIYEPDTPEEKKCDCDRVADYYIAKGFKSKTSIENAVTMAYELYDLDCRENDDVNYAEDCSIFDYIDLCGGLKEFDYYS